MSHGGNSGKKKGKSNDKGYKGKKDSYSNSVVGGKKRERPLDTEHGSRNAQFASVKAARKKARKPDAELVEEAKKIYNVVKPNDKALIVGGTREELIHDLLKVCIQRGYSVIFIV